MDEDIRARLREMPEAELLDLLDAVSDEVRRRNEIGADPEDDVRLKSPEQNLATVLQALAELGAGIKR